MADFAPRGYLKLEWKKALKGKLKQGLYRFGARRRIMEKTDNVRLIWRVFFSRIQ